MCYMFVWYKMFYTQRKKKREFKPYSAILNAAHVSSKAEPTFLRITEVD